MKRLKNRAKSCKIKKNCEKRKRDFMSAKRMIFDEMGQKYQQRESSVIGYKRKVEDR